MTRIGFGGGCHWCTEAVFQSLRGVGQVEQGFIRSVAPDDAWSEGVIVYFDPKTISLDTLIEVHLRTHSATSRHALREKYRSAVYVFDPVQQRTVRRAITTLQGGFRDRPITRVLPFDGFRASEARYQNYYRQHPEAAFCKRYIDPKLDLVKSRFAMQELRR